jgi:hypothetical protein
MPNLHLTTEELVAVHLALKSFLEEDTGDRQEAAALESCRSAYERIHQVLVWACGAPQLHASLTRQPRLR